MSVQLLKALKPQLDPLLHAPVPGFVAKPVVQGKMAQAVPQ
jgi:hypothetical protein